MKVLVACEESQEVCKAFRALGHEAYSCDTQECSGGHPEWHIMTDVRGILKRVSHGEDYPEPSIWFSTADGKFHEVEHWDLLIAHPPCTFLTAASAVRLFNKDHSIKDTRRYHAGEAAAQFFMSFFEADADRIAVENPVPLKVFDLPPYSQIIEPFMFGDPWKKRTCLWLLGLPMLHPTNLVEPKGLWVGSTCANRDPAIYTKYELHSNRDPRRRSKTFPGIARAMAEQWGGITEGGNMTQREELLSVPKRKWDDVIHGVDAVYVIPSGRK